MNAPVGPTAAQKAPAPTQRAPTSAAALRGIVQHQTGSRVTVRWKDWRRSVYHHHHLRYDQTCKIKLFNFLLSLLHFSQMSTWCPCYPCHAIVHTAPSLPLLPLSLPPGCVDIDECLEGVHGCPPSTVCFNTRGNHDCVCERGFELVNNTCIGTYVHTYSNEYLYN